MFRSTIGTGVKVSGIKMKFPAAVSAAKRAVKLTRTSNLRFTTLYRLLVSLFIMILKSK
jgi:hypothetical protein